MFVIKDISKTKIIARIIIILMYNYVREMNFKQTLSEFCGKLEFARSQCAFLDSELHVTLRAIHYRKLFSVKGFRTSITDDSGVCARTYVCDHICVQSLARSFIPRAPSCFSIYSIVRDPPRVSLQVIRTEAIGVHRVRNFSAKSARISRALALH